MFLGCEGLLIRSFASLIILAPPSVATRITVATARWSEDADNRISKPSEATNLDAKNKNPTLQKKDPK